MKTEIEAPNRLPTKYNSNSIFLAGSIEMGNAEEWQTKLINAVSDVKDLDIVFYNPRRKDWDSSWEQKRDNAQFYEQVQWELIAMERASLIVFCFDPNTKSPITLMELGIHHDDNIVVYCPEGFWRKGNVDIVCEHYNIDTVSSFEELVQYIEEYLSY